MSVGHYENFPVASRLVPRRLRPAVIAIYHFARGADDLADEGDVAAAERIAGLDGYDLALDAIAGGQVPAAPPFPALAAAIGEHRLPLQPFRELLSAFRQDVATGRYATYADLLDYCRRSANPVGRLLLTMYKVDAPADLAASDAICTGLQLTNFWQDIAVDWRKNRVYVPEEDLARFGVTIAAIAGQRVDVRWSALLAYEVARARALLHAGRPLVQRLPWRLGLELSAVIAGGLRILEHIDAAEGDVFTRRPVLGAWDWAVVAWRAMLPAPVEAREAPP